MLALSLVIGLALQAERASRIHRQAVASALRDYATFVAWQYTRRASDYLRLTIGTTIPYAVRQSGPLSSSLACERARNERREPAWCLTNGARQNWVAGALRNDSVFVERNDTNVSRQTIESAMRAALTNMHNSAVSIGLVPVGDVREARFLGYAFQLDRNGKKTAFDAVILDAQDLRTVFRHVAGFAPLLPPTFTGALPNDSLVSIQVLSDSVTIYGSADLSDGLSATDVLGPDLAGIRVHATLFRSAERRLVAANVVMPGSGTFGAALAVTLLLCVIAIMQLRKTQDITRLRGDFVASVSHELKTPLTQISLFAETLAAPRERTAAERREYALIIAREAKRLRHLVDGILHFAGMMRATTSLATTRESVLLGEELREAVAAFAPISESRNMTIELRVEREVELTLERDAFRQVVLNLLDNAFKFGPDGQTILVALSTQEHAVITVDDEGPGVPKSERDRVFEPYVRIDRAGTKAGSGIGLAVVRDVVRRHGGDVQIATSPHGGTRVSITLPNGSYIVPKLETAMR